MATNLTISAGASTPGYIPLTLPILKVWSKDAILGALPVLRYQSVVTVKTELEKQPGDSISFVNIANLKRGGKINENADLATTDMTETETNVRLHEFGNAVGVTEAHLRKSYRDTLDDISVMLGRDYAVVLDIEIRNKYHTSSYGIFAPLLSGGIWYNVAAAATLAVVTSELSPRAVRTAAVALSARNASKFDGTDYIAFATPHALGSIRNSSEWQSATQYGSPDRMYNGEVGKYESVRFIETTMAPNGTDASTNAYGQYADPGYKSSLFEAGASSADLHETLIVGEEGVALAVGMPMELRDDGVANFGRRHAIGWLSWMGAGLLREVNTETITSA